MTIEASQTINQLNPSFPRGTDLLKEGDDHIRMIKANLKTTFPNIQGVVNITHTVLNDLNSYSQWGPAGTHFLKDVLVDGAVQVHNGLTANALTVTNGTNLQGGLTIQGNTSSSNEIKAAGLVSTFGAVITGDVSSTGTIHGARGFFDQSPGPARQGIWVGWNEDAGTGQGNININRGRGTGGLRFRFVNETNTAEEGRISFSQGGNITMNGFTSNGGGETTGSMRSRGNLYIGSPAANDVIVQTDGNIVNGSGGHIFSQFGGGSDLNGALNWIKAVAATKVYDVRVANGRHIGNTNGGNTGLIVTGIGDFGSDDGYGWAGDLQVATDAGWRNCSVG